MKKNNAGYIAIHRKIFQNEFYDCEPKCKMMAWIDLLLLANHRKNSFMIRGIAVSVPRGSVGYSIDTLAGRWKWSKGKVKRWLNVLEKSGQVKLQKSNVTTLISIVNYSAYQSDSTANDTANGFTNGSQTDPNNNVNNEKNSAGRKNATHFPSAYPGSAPLRRIKP